MTDVKNCPKCTGEMRKGRLYTPHKKEVVEKDFFDYVNWKAVDHKKFGGVFAYKCEDCGYIEFYTESQQRKEK